MTPGAEATAAAPTPMPSATDVALVERDPVLVELRAKGAIAVGIARDLVVASPDAKAEGLELVARARKAVRTSETRRTALVKPHNDQVRDINRAFKEATDPFREVDTIVSGKVLAFDRAERQRAAEAAAAAERERLEAEALLREAEKAEAAGKPEVAGALLEKAIAEEACARDSQAQAKIPPKTVAVDAGTVSVRNKPWTYRVVDEACVPREYLCLDSPKIRDAIRRGEREIPGLEIFQEEGLAVRG